MLYTADIHAEPSITVKSYCNISAYISVRLWWKLFKSSSKYSDLICVQGLPTSKLDVCVFAMTMKEAIA